MFVLLLLPCLSAVPIVFLIAKYSGVSLNLLSLMMDMIYILNVVAIFEEI